MFAAYKNFFEEEFEIFQIEFAFYPTRIVSSNICSKCKIKRYCQIALFFFHIMIEFCVGDNSILQFLPRHIV